VVSSAGGMDGALTEMVRVKLDNLYDLVEIRIQLETWAARRAAERGSAEQIAAIGKIVDSMAKPGGNRSADDMDFHLAIGRAAASPVYLHVISTIRETLGQMVEFHHSPPFSVDEELMYRHHCAIHEALVQRQPDAAAGAMRDHLLWVLQRYQEMSTAGTTPLSEG
jgi:DNA-binding FadR family transcriptional regulator